MNSARNKPTPSTERWATASARSGSREIHVDAGAGGLLRRFFVPGFAAIPPGDERLDPACIDATVGAVHRDRRVVAELHCGGFYAHHARDAELPADDRGVTGPAAFLGDDGDGALHGRDEVRGRHGGYQDIAGLDRARIGWIENHPDGARANAGAGRGSGEK